MKDDWRILDRSLTRFTSQEMGCLRAREGSFGHCCGIWEDEACSPLPSTLPSSVSCVRNSANQFWTLRCVRELVSYCSQCCPASSGLEPPLKSKPFQFTLLPASLRHWLVCDLTVLALQAAWATLWCLNWNCSPCWECECSKLKPGGPKKKEQLPMWPLNKYVPEAVGLSLY